MADGAGGAMTAARAGLAAKSEDDQPMDALGHARTVLVVEDNVLMRKLFVRCLEEGGYTVVEATDPREVVALMHEQRPDLVVTDIVMPGLSGMELIRDIRADALLAAVPVLAVTNLVSSADKRRLAEAGFDGHLAKPIKPKDFLEVVGGFLDPVKDAPN